MPEIVEAAQALRGLGAKVDDIRVEPCDERNSCL